MFIPIHINRKKYLHWSIVVVDMDEKSIVYFDSGSGEDHKDVLINVTKYLVDEHRAKKASEAGQSLFGNIKLNFILFYLKFYRLETYQCCQCSKTGEWMGLWTIHMSICRICIKRRTISF